MKIMVELEVVTVGHGVAAVTNLVGSQLATTRLRDLVDTLPAAGF